MLLTNAFSFNMIPQMTQSMAITATPITVAQAREIFEQEGLVSAVGHETTAALLSDVLGMPVPAQRTTVRFDDDCSSSLIVAQYVGLRLNEGATVLPEGPRIIWILVRIAPAWCGD